MRIPLIASAAALAAGSVCAHSDLPREDWCHAGRIAYVADFKLGAKQIAASCTGNDTGTKLRRGGAERAGVAPNHCGQFDPPYNTARVAASGHCGLFGLPSPDVDFGTTAAIVTGPESYLAAEHHEIYRIEAGVWGMCAICLPPGE